MEAIKHIHTLSLVTFWQLAPERVKRLAATMFPNFETFRASVDWVYLEVPKEFENFTDEDWQVLYDDLDERATARIANQINWEA